MRGGKHWVHGPITAQRFPGIIGAWGLLDSERVEVRCVIAGLITSFIVRSTAYNLKEQGLQAEARAFGQVIDGRVHGTQAPKP